jgi:hypothetical protein
MLLNAFPLLHFLFLRNVYLKLKWLNFNIIVVRTSLKIKFDSFFIHIDSRERYNCFNGRIRQNIRWDFRINRRYNFMILYIWLLFAKPFPNLFRKGFRLYIKDLFYL